MKQITLTSLLVPFKKNKVKMNLDFFLISTLKIIIFKYNNIK